MNHQLMKEFFDEQFRNTSGFFLYKDKQLLKESKFKEYAEAQIKKADRVFWSIFYLLFVFSWYGVAEFVEYGADPAWYHLAIGLGSWAILIILGFLAAKEYYVVKSSMTLLLKILRFNEKDQTIDVDLDG
jgi:hypothetical protein